MKHFLVYTALRLALFIACYVVVAGLLSLFLSDKHAIIWGVVGGAVVSSFLSLKFLAGPRDRFAEVIEARAGRAKERFEQARSREDVD